MDYEALERDYIFWLCDQVGIDTLDERSWILINALYEKEFYWTVPNDDNRVKDGLELRNIYADTFGVDVRELPDGPCTIFEMLVALSQRCAYLMTDFDKVDTPARWFWEMIENLGIDISLDYYDEEATISIIDDILDRLVERTYSKSGKHGLFPLIYPEEDQREVEIYYQMSAYLMEHYYI